jgi:hypothetical protein
VLLHFIELVTGVMDQAEAQVLQDQLVQAVYKENLQVYDLILTHH